MQGARNSERKMTYGEAYQRVFPTVGEVFLLKNRGSSPGGPAAKFSAPPMTPSKR
jgi:hypothetical protein